MHGRAHAIWTGSEDAVHRMPWTSVIFLMAVLAIAALPPFNGFVSEWLTLQTLLRSADLPSVPWKIDFFTRTFELPPCHIENRIRVVRRRASINCGAGDDLLFESVCHGFSRDSPFVAR